MSQLPRLALSPLFGRAIKVQSDLMLRSDRGEEPRHQSCGPERWHVGSGLTGSTTAFGRVARCDAAVGIAGKRSIQAQAISRGQRCPEIIETLKHVGRSYLHGI